MRPAAFLALALLAACGADGAPVPPAKSAAQPAGITITGDARFGIVHRSP
jgi:hypothetical protein